MPRASATETDRTVGARIISVRKAKGLSQSALGDAVGVTFQQIQKYENGQNRVTAGRLKDIAKFLKVPVESLLSGAFEDPELAIAFDLLGLPGAVGLLKAFSAIEDAQLRQDILALACTAARMSAGPSAGNA